MEIYDSEDIKVYMLIKRILFFVMLIVLLSVVVSEKVYELYDSIYGGKFVFDVINILYKMVELGDIDVQSLLGWEYYQFCYDIKFDVQEVIKWFELVVK